MRAEWDAVVVGAGPAGAVAARELARRGLSVLLAERRAFPRAKVCGGCLNAHGVATLTEAGVGGVLDRTSAVGLAALRLSAGGRVLDMPLSGGVAIDRSFFDEALVDEAMAAGAQFAPETQVVPGPVEARLRRLRLRTAGGDQDISAAVVIAADGLGSTMLGGDSTPLRGSRLGAGVQVDDFDGAYEARVVHMAVGRSGYVGLVRLGDGRLNVAAALDAGRVRSAGGLGAAALEVLEGAGLPALPELRAAAWTGTPALTRRPASPAAERVFAVGDASGYVEPFTGEGMAWALSDALAVAPLAEEAAAEWRPAHASQWARRHHERTRASRRRCRAIAQHGSEAGPRQRAHPVSVQAAAADLRPRDGPPLGQQHREPATGQLASGNGSGRARTSSSSAGPSSGHRCRRPSTTHRR